MVKQRNSLHIPYLPYLLLPVTYICHFEYGIFFLNSITMGVVSFNQVGKHTTSIKENFCYFEHTNGTIFGIRTIAKCF